MFAVYFQGSKLESFDLSIVTWLCEPLAKTGFMEVWRQFGVSGSELYTGIGIPMSFYVVVADHSWTHLYFFLGDILNPCHQLGGLSYSEA